MRLKKLQKNAKSAREKGLAALNALQKKKMSTAAFNKKMAEIIKGLPIGANLHIPGKEIEAIIDLKVEIKWNTIKYNRVTVIFYRDKIIVSYHDILTYLQYIPYVEHGIFNLEAFQDTLKEFLKLPRNHKRKLPIPVETQTLICIDKQENIWVNLRRIKDIDYSQETNFTQIEMECGVIFPTTYQRETMNKILERGIICAFFIGLDHLHLRYKLNELTLSEMLEIPLRPHIINIFKKIRTEDWVFPLWDFKFRLEELLMNKHVSDILAPSPENMARFEAASIRQVKYTSASHTRCRKGKVKSKD